MPLYRYICDDCGRRDEEFSMIKDRKEYIDCPCGKKMRRDYSLREDMICGDKERISVALGVHPSQIESGEVFKVHPGAKFTKEGYMILRNRAEQKQRLKERGWINQDSYGNY